MRNHDIMTSSRLSLCGLLAFSLAFVGCDGDDKGKAPAAKKAVTPGAVAKGPGANKSADPKPAAASADDGAAKSGTPVVDSPKADPAAADPATAEPTPAEPTPSADAPAEVTPTAEPTEPGDADPSAVADPGAGADDGGAGEDEPAAAPSAGGAEVNNIALGDGGELLRLVLAHDVESRQPVDPAVSFPAGHKVNLFVEASNEGEDTAVRVAWERVSTGRRTSATTVRIPHRKLHRTRAYKTLKKPGEYRCVVLGAGDEELASIPFTIEEA